MMGTIVQDFHRDGFVIVKAAISPQRAAYYRNQQLRWLENSRLGFNRHETKSWTKDQLPAHFKQGIYTAVAHEAFMWDARLEPGIIDPFAQIWNTEQLLVSFDGMNVTMPGAEIAPWPHTDQHSSDPDFICAQGLLNTGPCGPDDGGLILVRRSAKLWRDFWADEAYHVKSKHDSEALKERDQEKFNEDDVRWFTKRGCVVEKLLLSPGDLVIWDSRTIHYNCGPKKEIRSAIYLCYGPSEGAEIDKKAGLYFGFQSSNHWPNVNIRAVQDARPRREHVWTNRLAQLAGIEPYS